MIDREVAQLAGVARSPAIRLAIEDETAANSHRNGQVDEVSDAPRSAGPEAVLGERRRRGVVVDHSRAIERPFGDVHDRHVVPAGEVGRRQDDPPIGIERTAARDPHGGDDVPRDARFEGGFATELDLARDHLLRPLARSARGDDERADAPVGTDDPGHELGAADVEAEKLASLNRA